MLYLFICYVFFCYTPTTILRSSSFFLLCYALVNSARVFCLVCVACAIVAHDIYSFGHFVYVLSRVHRAKWMPYFYFVLLIVFLLSIFSTSFCPSCRCMEHITFVLLSLFNHAQKMVKFLPTFKHNFACL